ncbi:transglutaminase domain-containing protein [Tenacibaculum sp. 190524A02b]|uniref:transglutaminase domain-containing protein n=1 Tax=Tenacibaculum vairaonense TaxID=3137860 RepID=UPI0031FB0744
MRNITYHLLALLLFSSTLFAQRDKPTEEAVKLAQSLKEKYEEEDVVISDYSIEINFELNRKTNKVEVIESKSITFLAISKRADLWYSTGYDKQSEIKKLKLYGRRGREKFWNYRDEAYSDESIFHNDYRIRYGEINLPLQGYVRKVKEVKRYKDIKYFTVEYLKKPHRIIKGNLVINIPQWLSFSTKDFHFKGFEINKTESKTEKHYVLSYTFKNIAGIKKEAAKPGNSYLHPHIVYLSKAFTDKEGNSHTLFKNTADLYTWYKKLVDDVAIKTDDIKAKVEEITKGIENDEDKIKAIYYWVQDSIKYIAFEDGIAGFKPDAPQNVYNKKYGDCKGMAILLKTMLVEAGFDARLVWIGTDAIAYDYSLPSLIVDNHMISGVMLNDKFIFLDGTEKYNAYGTYASRIQGKEALIENKDNFILKRVPEAQPEYNKEIYKGKLTIVDNNITGTINRSLAGEHVSEFLYGFTGTPKDKREEVMCGVLADGNDNAKVSDVQGFDFSDRDKEINLDYKLEINNVVSGFGNNLYLELDPVRYLSNWELKEDREAPLLLRMKRRKIKELSLELPTGYKVESLPESVKIENDFMTFEASYVENAGKVVYSSNIILKKRLIPKDKLALWNTSINKIKNFYDEQITLVKN